jgi:hypothetical protein
MTIKRIEQFAFPLLLLILGSVAIIQSLILTAGNSEPNWLAGPGGFMMLIGCILIGICLFELLVLFRAAKADNSKVSAKTAVPDETTEKKKQDIFLRNMLITLGLLMVYALCIRVLGFSLATGLFLVIDLKLLKNSWPLTVFTVLVILALMLFGAPWMGISLPRGLFGF